VNDDAVAAVVANDAVDGVKVIDVAADDVVAKLDVVATLLVPNNDPVIPPEFMRSEPVIIIP